MLDAQGAGPTGQGKLPRRQRRIAVIGRKHHLLFKHRLRSKNENKGQLYQRGDQHQFPIKTEDATVPVGVGIRLIGINAFALRRRRGDLERCAQILRLQISAFGPACFLVGHLAREHLRRADVVLDEAGLADGNPPIKFADHVRHLGFAGTEEFVVVTVTLETRRATRNRRRAGEGTRKIPVPIVFSQPGKAFLFVEQQIFRPRVVDTAGTGTAPHEADRFPTDAKEHALAAERQPRHHAHGLRCGGEQLNVLVFDANDRAATIAGHTLDGARMHRQRRGAMRAVKGLGLDRRHRRTPGGIPKISQLELVKLGRIANKDQRRRFTVVERDEAVVTAQVGGIDVVTGLHLERQFALTGDAARLFKVSYRKVTASDVDLHLWRQRCELRNRLGDLHLRADDIFPRRFGQPGTAPVVEKDMPLVPQAGLVLELDAANHAKMQPAERSLSTDLNQRRIVEQIGHAPEVFQVLAIAQQGTATKLAHGISRGRRPEINRGAAGGAVGGFHWQPQ